MVSHGTEDPKLSPREHIKLPYCITICIGECYRKRKSVLVSHGTEDRKLSHSEHIKFTLLDYILHRRLLQQTEELILLSHGIEDPKLSHSEHIKFTLLHYILHRRLVHGAACLNCLPIFNRELLTMTTNDPSVYCKRNKYLNTKKGVDHVMFTRPSLTRIQGWASRMLATANTIVANHVNTNSVR